MTCDIFIKSFPSDYQWLAYCLRSIDRFCAGFRRVVIVAPDNECPRAKMETDVVVQPDEQPGYLWQQVVKLHADTFTDADFILFMDSDCIFTKPVTPQSFMHEDRVVWNRTHWEDARPDERKAWVPVIERFMGTASKNSFMTRHPFMFQRWLFRALREFCLKKHGVELIDYILQSADPKNSLTFSEFNCAGAFAHAFHRGAFDWPNTATDAISPPCVHQEWSRGGITPEISSKLEAMLA